jgi:hypothetical protein
MTESIIPTQEEYDNAKRDELRRSMGFPVAMFGPDLIREALAATEAMSALHSIQYVGAGRRTIFTQLRQARKSHAGKPHDYVKPYGVRPKGYAKQATGFLPLKEV